MKKPTLNEIDELIPDFEGHPQHYKLLAWFSKQFNDITIVEVGTHKGYGSLALAYNKRNKVKTFDIKSRDGEIELPENVEKKIIYSAIIGDYDKPIIHDIPEGWEYRLYTNTKNIPGTHFVESHLSNKKFARYIKIMPWDFFDFDVCLWIDGNTIFDKNKIEELCNSDFVISKHPIRDCIYEEGDAIKKFRKDLPINIDNMTERFRSEGFPEHYGLVASHAIIRKNTESNREFCSRWWYEVKNFSHRDQMSFNYVLWKYNIPIKLIEFNTIFKATTSHRDRV